MAWCPFCKANHQIVVSTHTDVDEVETHIQKYSHRWNESKKEWEDVPVGHDTSSEQVSYHFTEARCSNCYRPFQFPNATTKNDYEKSAQIDLDKKERAVKRLAEQERLEEQRRKDVAKREGLKRDAERIYEEQRREELRELSSKKEKAIRRIEIYIKPLLLITPIVWLLIKTFLPELKLVPIWPFTLLSSFALSSVADVLIIQLTILSLSHLFLGEYLIRLMFIHKMYKIAITLNIVGFISAIFLPSVIGEQIATWIIVLFIGTAVTRKFNLNWVRR